MHKRNEFANEQIEQIEQETIVSCGTIWCTRALNNMIF